MACSRCEASGQGSWFGYRWDVCERWSVLTTGVTPVSWWPLVIVVNLGTTCCLVII
jgi:hypothetical protein